MIDGEPIVVPPVMVRNVTGAWGAVGERWLDGLPALVDSVARDWELVLGAPFALSYHWVVAATQRDGAAAVLKLGPPEPGHLAVEAAALRAYDGRGAVRLLAYDADRGALLLERAQPGTLAAALVPHRDVEATAAAIAVARRLHAAPLPSAGLEPLQEQGGSFARYLRDHLGDGPLPRDVVVRAAGLFAELCASAAPPVLLHGDLHHDNLLRSDREPWLAIDPFGLVGDPGYEAGALLFNPDPDRRDDALLALVPARVEQLADGLGLPPERVAAWGYVKAVLSEVWTTEGQVGQAGGRTGRALDVALTLLPRLR
jgi:streptomycin 6-kinase